MQSSAALFAAVFATLWVAHTVGDHWVQTSAQSAHKGENDKNPGQSSRIGRHACTRHVIGLTITKGILLAASAVALDLQISAAGVTAGLALDAGSHWWADRRSTLAWLAKVAGKAEFYRLGTDTVHTTTGTDGITGKHIGSGAYALDQSFHALFLFFAALIIATV